MFRNLSLSAVMLFVFCVATATAVDYRVEVLNEPPPAEGVAAGIVEKMAPSGYRVFRGNTRVVCDIWVCKQWETKDDFTATNTILYPFEVGRLFGLIRYHRSGEDFRGQEIGEGVYTLRYAQQPVDGNHIGTSDTLDFLLMSPVDEDDSPEPIDEDTLFAVSAATAGTTHPAMLSFLKAEGAGGQLPTMQHDEARDFWSIRLSGDRNGKEPPEKLVVEFVIVGVAEI